MNRTETIAVVTLSLILLGWFYYASQQAKNMPRERKATPEEEMISGDTMRGPAEGTHQKTTNMSESADEKVIETYPSETTDVSPAPESKKNKGPELPESRVVVSSSAANTTFSSWGGGIVDVELTEYNETLADDSRLLRMNFEAAPALRLEGIPGLSTNADFEITRIEGGRGLRIFRRTDYGLVFERLVKPMDGYQIMVEDNFRNESDGNVDLPSFRIYSGSMDTVKTKAATRMSYLGIDSFSPEGKGKVVHWAKKGSEISEDNLSKRFTRGRAGGGCGPFRQAPTRMLPAEVEFEVERTVDWVAPKNKFFVQILDPEEETAGYVLRAERFVPETEDEDNPSSWMRDAQLERVAAAVSRAGMVLGEGDSITHRYSYYAGPKKFDIIKTFGVHQKEIMEFGFLKSICELLLRVLNWIYGIIHNYGVAIIIITIIVRVIFWPITHKSTESMKKMQKIQPLVAEIREKHKDNPQKMNKEVMALYKEHKVNPAAGCLPILVQIPVFIALFTVLRSAVELRFAEFLWIKDLSEPERLLDFGFKIPIIGWDTLNILPLLMTGVTFAQQKLTPTAGDSQQQKIMAFMPIMLLVFFYNMPSGLILYWTTSQLLAVIQMAVQKKKTTKEAVA